MRGEPGSLNQESIREARRPLRKPVALAWAMTVASLATLALPTGCSRGHYRQQADADSYAAIRERTDDPRWDLPRISIDPDPRSRFADPSCDPDHPPMPPDDPAAHDYMHCADGKRGSKHWHDYGDSDQVENPDWQESLGLNKDGVLVVDETRSLEIALINNRNYQQQLENLYLSALDLTFQRFRFDTWYFAGNNTQFRHFGTGGADNIPPEKNTLTTSNAASADGAGGRGLAAGAGAGRLYPTGATLLVNFANSFVWQFAGPNTHSTTSILNLNFIQPILRNAGRKVVMEALTKSERSVLYAARDFERYRQSFYVDITTGSGVNVAVQRAAGLSAGLGADLAFGSAGGSQVFGGGTGGGGVTAGATTSGATGGTGAGNVQGFLGLVQLHINIRNLEYNVSATADSLAQLDALQEAGRVDIIQVDQARQRLATAKSNLLQQRAAYDSQKDSFKLQLGLPPSMKIEIDESKFAFLELIDRGLVDLQNQVELLLNRVRELPEVPTPSEALEITEASRKLTAPAANAFAAAQDDFATLQTGLDRRLQSIPSQAERKAFLEEIQTLFENHRLLEKKFQATIQAIRGETQATPAEHRKEVQQNLTDLSGQLLEISLMQTRARLEVIELTPLEFTEEKAIQTAFNNELSLMNARAQLVDTWREIEFRANQLKSDLNLTFNADFETPGIGTNPMDFRAANSSYTMGVRFDAPLTRVSERNQYREVLVRYQQARRGYLQSEDRVVSNLRAELRNMSLNRSNFELRRNGLVIALRQVDQTREKLNEPPKVGQVGATSTTTARDLLEALVNLLNNQNDFISVWFNSEAVRRSFYRDSGLMRIGENGVWVDAYGGSEDKDNERNRDSLEGSDQSSDSGDKGPSDQATQFPRLLPVQAETPPEDETLPELSGTLIREPADAPSKPNGYLPEWRAKIIARLAPLLPK